MLLSITLTGTFLARSTDATTPTTVESTPPQFLGWAGNPFSDGLNHYLVRVADTYVTDTNRWLVLDGDDRLVAVDAAPSGQNGVRVGDIEAAVSGSEYNLAEDAVVALVRGHRAVTGVRAVGFGFYAVTGSIGAAELSLLPGVVDVAADVALTAATVDPYYPSQWSLENNGTSANTWTMAYDADIDAPEGWHRTRGTGVVVAVIDSGVDVTHPDLAANVWHNGAEQCDNGTDDDGNGYVDDCAGWDFANSDGSVEDLVGHGTHVAGIIAAEADNGIGVAGVAYEAKVMALKIGDGAPALSAALEAFAYAIDNGARIINASWLIDDSAAAPYLDTALVAAEQAGILVVTGAGNEPIDLDTSPVYPASSTLNNVIAVGASTATDLPATFSGYGSTTVDLFAPGESIISTVPGGYGVYSGTSMAAPMVAGAAALLWAATPQATYAEVKGALLDRSDGPNDGVTTFRGLASSHGRLNVERSIYTRLFQPSMMYTFHDFNSFEPDVAHPVVVTAKSVDPWIEPPQTPTMYRAGLYVPVDGKPMAVIGHPITYSDAAGELTISTDNTGRALVGRVFEPQERSAFVQDGDTTSLTMTLPAGTYAFVMEVVDVTEPDGPVTMGDPSAVFFIVNEDGTISAMPEISLGDQPPPSTTVPDVAPNSTTTSGAITTTTALPVAISTTSAPPMGNPSTTTTRAPAPPTTVIVSTTTSTVPPATTAPPSSTTSPPNPTTAAPTTTTTAAPTTSTVPGGSTTTTTPTTEPPPDPNTMSVTDVSPAQGPTSGGILATVTGRNLPELADVYFGNRRAETVSIMAPTFVVVDVPPGVAGPVDVVLVDRATGDETMFPDGFTYIDEDNDPGPTPATEGPTTTLAVTTTTPATTTSTSIAPTTSSTPTTAPPVAPPQGTLDDWLESVLRTPEGLTFADPAPDDPMASLPLEAWAGALCDEPVCPGWVVEG
jgi:subtilisin family serine protease